MGIRGNFKVVYIGPFYTGFFINTATLINSGYISIQERLLKHLKNKKKKGWFIEGGKEETTLWDTEFKSVYGGTTKTPPSFIGKLAVPLDRTLEFENVRFNIEHGIFFYHDFGVGTFRVDVSIELLEETEVRKYRELVEQFSTKIGENFNPLLESNTKDLELSLKELKIPIESYEDFSIDLEHKGLEHLNFRSCLWYHRAFVFELERGVPITEDDYNKYKDVLFSSQLMGPQNCSLNEYAQVYPSFNYSLFIYDKNHLPRDIQLNRVLELAEYYYAATSLLDTILFNQFTKFTANKDKTPTIKELKEELNSLRALAEQLDLFLLILKDSIVNFSPSSVIMWRNLDNEWYYTPLLESLKEKNILLDEKVTEKLEALTQKRAETMNRLLKIFTIFAIIGPILELYSIMKELNLLSFITNNFAVIAITASCLISLLILFFYIHYKKGVGKA